MGAIYTDVETRLTELLSAHAKRATRMLVQVSEVSQFRRQASAIVSQAAITARSETADVIDTAVHYGARSAMQELGETPAQEIAQPHRVKALARQAVIGVEQSTFQILPRVTDVYTRTMRDIGNAAMLGVETPADAAKRALNKFADQGITVFTRGGSQTHISAYVEMYLRTSLMNAALQGHADQLESRGHRLVVVSDHSQECKNCRPFEGEVLSLDGSRGLLELPGPGGKNTQVRVMDTVRNARSKGLFHPNCRHSFSAYLPGITRSFGHTADPQGDKDRQHLRKLERDLRAARMREAAAIDADSITSAKQRARQIQGRIREHTAATSAKRQPERERITGRFAQRLIRGDQDI